MSKGTPSEIGSILNAISGTNYIGLVYWLLKSLISEGFKPRTLSWENSRKGSCQVKL